LLALQSKWRPSGEAQSPTQSCPDQAVFFSSPHGPHGSSAYTSQPGQPLQDRRSRLSEVQLSQVVKLLESMGAAAAAVVAGGARAGAPGGNGGFVAASHHSAPLPQHNFLASRQPSGQGVAEVSLWQPSPLVPELPTAAGPAVRPPNGVPQTALAAPQEEAAPRSHFAVTSPSAAAWEVQGSPSGFARQPPFQEAAFSHLLHHEDPLWEPQVPQPQTPWQSMHDLAASGGLGTQGAAAPSSSAATLPSSGNGGGSMGSLGGSFGSYGAGSSSVFVHGGDGGEEERPSTAHVDNELLHATGSCKPCIFHHRGVCHRQPCDYCHLPHENARVRQVRLSKTTTKCLRERIQIARQLDA